MQLPNNNAGDKNDHDKSNGVGLLGLPHGENIGTGILNNDIGQISNQEPDFSEFMWMASENLEDFDQKVIHELDQQYGIDSASGLEEEDFLHQMLEEEEETNTVYFPNHPMVAESCVNDLSKRLHKMEVTDGLVAQSNLNPFAAEFVPGGQEFQSPTIASPIAVMAQPNTHPMTSQIYATNMTPSLQGNALNLMQANMQSIMWRQNSPHMRFSLPMQAQMNGQGLRAMYAPNAPPLYVSNMPLSMFPAVMNGGEFLRPPQNRFHLPDAPDRCIEDEGYEDN